jgi:hypothetical protein
MTRNSSRKRSIAFLSIAQSRRLALSNISVLIKDTPASRSNVKPTVVTIYRMFRPKAPTVPNPDTDMGKPAAGKSNARILGSIVPGGC